MASVKVKLQGEWIDISKNASDWISKDSPYYDCVIVTGFGGPISEIASSDRETIKAIQVIVDEHIICNARKIHHLVSFSDKDKETEQALGKKWELECISNWRLWEIK